MKICFLLKIMVITFDFLHRTHQNKWRRGETIKVLSMLKPWVMNHGGHTENFQETLLM